MAAPPTGDADAILPQPQQQFPSKRHRNALKQLFCGGLAGSVAKTVTAPLSRLTILFQVHSLVTTKEHRPKFAMTISSGLQKIIERGGIVSLWKGNMTSVLHRFPYSAINFYVYESTLTFLGDRSHNDNDKSGNDDVDLEDDDDDEATLSASQLVRRVTKFTWDNETRLNNNNAKRRRNHSNRSSLDSSTTYHKFAAGATAGTSAVLACYPLDLVRTRLTTELEGREHYRGIVDCFRKIVVQEGFTGLYAGIVPTLLVAVPNFAISYTVYGTLKEYMLDDDLFYNLRRIDADSGETRLGALSTVSCGAASGILATLVTFPMDTIRRRMQVQTLHVSQQLTSRQLFMDMLQREGLASIYRGLTPELLKVVPMVGTMFFVYENAKRLLNVSNGSTRGR